MGWFKIDDGFHCHPKVFAAGTSAVGLYVRCGSWAAQQTTDGIVPKQIARMYGSPRMIKALVGAGLWHEHGHDCLSCPEVGADSYVIHQYLERNSSRIEVELARKMKSERQQRWREGKRNAQVNGIEKGSVDAPVDASTSHHGDAAPIPPQPIPTTPYGSSSNSSTRASELPDFAIPLVDQMAAAGIVVDWRLSLLQWDQVHQALERSGAPALVEYARRRHRPDRPAFSARAFVRDWLTLPVLDSHAALEPAAVQPAAPVSQTTAMLQRAMARAQAREAAEA